MNNWEDAQNAYADAMDSAGVATQAQETYMTSLQAKTDQFNASMQEFYYDFLDSSLAKGVVDFGTEIIQAFDGILDKVGSVTTAIGAVGLFSVVQSVGKAFSYAAKNGTTFAEGLTSVSSTVSALTHGMTAFNQAYYAGGTGLFQSVGTGISVFVKSLSPLTKALAVIAAVTAAITLFNQVYKSPEDIIKEGQEAQTNIDDVFSEYQSQANKVREYGDRYEELSIGVNVETNENISLTSEEYEEYLSLCNEIAEIYPQLVESYDEQGNAILNLGSSAETATDQLEALLEMDQAVAEGEISGDFEKAFKGAKTQIEQYEDEIESLRESSAQNDFMSDWMSDQDFESQLEALVNREQDVIHVASDMSDTIGKALTEAGFSYRLNWSDLNNDGIWDVTDFIFDSWPSDKQMEESFDSILAAYNTGVYELENAMSSSTYSNDLQERVIRQDISDTWDGVINAYTQQLGLSSNFTQLSDDVQNNIIDALSNIDYTDIPEDKYNVEDIQSYLRDTYLTPIAGAFNDEGATEVQDAFDNLFSLDTSKLTTGEYRDALDENLDTIKDYYIDALGETAGEEYFEEFVLNFGFKIETDDGSVKYAANQVSNDLYNAFQDELSNNDSVARGIFDALSVDEKQAMLDYFNDPSVAENSVSGFMQLYRAAIGDAQEEISSGPTLASLFTTTEGEETQFSKDVDTFQSDIDNINSSLDDLRNGEQVNTMDLFQDFPELEESLGDLEGGLERLSIDKLHEFSQAWAEATEGLEGDQLEAANILFADIVSSLDLSTYMDKYSQAYSDYESQIESMADAGGEAAVEMSDDLKQATNELESIAIGNVLANIENPDIMQRQGVGTTIRSLFEKYAGDTAGLEAIIELSANPDSANWTVQEWIDNVEATKVEIEVDAYTESLEKLENNLDLIQMQATKIDNEMSRKDIFGIQYSQQDYRDLTNNMNLQLQNLRAQKAVMEEQLVTLDPLGSEYADVASQIQSVESEIISAIGDQQEWNAAAEALNYEAGEALSAYNDATSTRNAGDNYTDMLKALEDTQALYEEGLVGTDEFKAGAAMFSAAGMEDAANWVENYDTALRYFTEDNSGCINFLNDLSEKTNAAGDALAEFDESTDTWTYNIGDIQDSANQLGISMEEFQAIMGRLQDYGFTNDWFNSVEDGAAHVGDLYADLAQAEMKLQDLEEERASGNEAITDTVLASQEAEINGIKNSIVQSEVLLDQYIATSAEDFEAQTQAQYSALTSMLDMASEIDASDERVLSSYYQSIQSWADENNIDIAGLFTYDDTGRITGLCEEVYDEIKGIAGENAYALDFDLTYAQQEVESVGQTLKDAYADTESGVQEMVDSIVSSYSGEDLMSIVFGDGSYAEGLEDAEYAMDGLIESLGLAQDEGSTLAQILASYQETGNWDEAIQSVSDSMQVYSTALDQLQAEGNIEELQNISFDVEVDDLSLDETEDRLDTLSEARQAIVDADIDETTRETALAQIDSLIDDCEDHTVKLKVETAVESGENDIDSLMSMYESGDLAGFAEALGLEVDITADTSELDAAYAELQSMDQQQEITATINAVLEENAISEADLLGMYEPDLEAMFETELKLHPNISMEDIESQLGYTEVEVPVTMQLEESQFEALTSQTEKVDVEVDTDNVASQIESAVAGASATVDNITVNTDNIAGQIEAAASGIEVTIPVAFETSGADIDTVSAAAPTPQSTSVEVTASVSGEGEINSLVSAIESVNSKYVAVTANVSGTAEVRSLISAISSVTGKVVSVSAVVSGQGEVNALASSIAAVQSKTVTVTTVTQTVSGGEATSPALGTAHVSGTAYSMWTGYRHSIGAYADGSTQDWALPKNEQAIVNEIGTESIVLFLCDFTW